MNFLPICSSIIAIPSLFSSSPNSSREHIIPSLNTPLISVLFIVKLISDACDKNKVFIPAPVIPIKIVASLLDRFSWFPISRDQLTMLLEGNECDSSDVFELFEIDKPIGFSLENLSYLSDEADE